MDQQDEWCKTRNIIDENKIIKDTKNGKLNGGFGEECRKVIGLICIHSLLYVAKFFFLVFIASPVAVFQAESARAIIVNSFIMLSGLVFDQLGQGKMNESFDFKKIVKARGWMPVYIIALFTISGFFLIFIDKNFEVNHFLIVQIATYIILFTSSFSAVVEAIVHIPDEALPSMQQKEGKPKRGINTVDRIEI